MSDSRPRRSEFLPFSRPTITDDEIAEVVDSLRSGWITTGPKVARFEAMFCERLGVAHAVSVCSATAGLHLAVDALELAPEDEVIVPSLTWASTANVVELCGARTVLADVDADTLCLDPADLERRITPETRAVIPVHFAGQPVDMDAVRRLAEMHGLAVIEDAAHALGTAYRGTEVGASGGTAVFSFHPIKNITTAEGGMVVCNDGALAERLRVKRFHGVSKDAWKRSSGGAAAGYDVVAPGWKYNMTDLQAAIGLHQMAKLDSFNARRRELAERYGRMLAEVPEVAPLGLVRYPATHAWHLYVVRLDLEAVDVDREGFMTALREENIGTGLHFPALHMSSYYATKYGHHPEDLPNSAAAGRSVVSLPLFPLMTEGDQDDVVAALKRVIAQHRRAET